MKYEYATRAHAPAWNRDKKTGAMCGSASAALNPLDDQPITDSIEEFQAIPKPNRCWECESIIS